MAKIARRHLTPWAWIGGGLLLAAVAARATDPIDPATGPEITALSVSASSTTVLVGGTSQLSVIATFDDGSTRDVTSDPKTSVGNSPAGAVSIGANGVIGGLAPGDVSITAFHQTYTRALSATLAVTVRTADDRDGDGLSDAVEIAHQLNPDFAGDASADLDQDGLTNAQEIALGTDLRKADTDGDFAPDGLEVAAGTDPLVSNLPPPPPPPVSDLNGSCVISVLNRSARVEANGVWVLPNVPSSSGRVRARATCVENGVSRSGQSEFFTIPTNGVISVSDIQFDTPQPIPSKLDLLAPTTSLTSAGQTVQLLARATYPGGAQADLTASASGTGYRTSNAAIAAVSAEGLVTAHASGTAVVSALSEGALGVVQIRVLLSGDSDGDGLPDDFEIANGLDPNNPLDVLDDLDGDGLTNGEEFALGTGLRIPDSDGDGLRDGDEVNRYRTNPLLFDTDGDEVGDGLEIESGSDPLDPASLNLAAILVSLSATPSALDLVFDTVVGEASQRLTVTGRLIDGRTINLRLRGRGTTYVSSDLAVASFGAEDGRVFAGQDGTATVTVSNSGKSATVAVQVSTFTPGALSFLSIPGFPNGVDVGGDLAFVASGSAGLYVVDVSNLAQPRILGSLETGGNANDVRMVGDRAYVADGTNGLLIVDVSDPGAPALLGRADTPGVATDIALRDDFAYVADGNAGLAVIDVSVPTAPVLRGQVDTSGNARGVDVGDGGLVVVADDGGGVVVIDATNPAAPSILGRTHTRGYYSSAADVRVRGNLAYVADAAGFTMGGLKVVDLRVPRTPVVVGRTTDSFALDGIAVEDGFVLASDYFFYNGVPIFNVGDPQTPTFTANLNFGVAPLFRDDNGNGIAVRNGAVFMVGVAGYITDNGVVANGGLHIGRYRSAQDTAGIAPAVSLTAPAAGASARERSTIPVRAVATDDVRVVSVRFLLDGATVATDFRAPYEANVRVPVSVPTATLTAIATDLAGNQTTSDPVVFTVIPDQRPTVSILAPNAGSRSVEGTTIDIAIDATDDVQVASVEIRVDGVPQVRTAPPYRFTYAVPVGATAVSIEATATDNAGQATTTGPQSFPVLDDPPPTVAILEPAPGSSVIEGSRIRVGIGAVDDTSVAFVELLLGGEQQLGIDDRAPYQITIDVPVGVSFLNLRADATDSLGQVGNSASLTLAVVPDPLTTAEGRALDENGDPVVGADVDCLGAAGTTGPGGTFSVSGVPTIASDITCSVTASGAGDDRSGLSAPQPPVPGDVTPVGDIVLTAKLLYASTGDLGGQFGPGRLYAFDTLTSRFVPQSETFEPAGLRALAFSPAGELYAIRSFGPSPEIAPRAIGTGSTSELLRLDADTGEILETVGPIRENFSEGFNDLGIDDLTWSPVTGLLYGLDVGQFGDARRIYEIDPLTAEAHPLSDYLYFRSGGLSAAPDGLLYVFGQPAFAETAGRVPAGSRAKPVQKADSPVGNGALSSDVLVAINPTDGTEVSRTDVGGYSLGVESLEFRPGRTGFLFFGEGQLMELDLQTLSVEPSSLQHTGEPLDRPLVGLDFRPASGTGRTTELVGRTVDAGGRPVADLSVEGLGGSATSDAAGQFSIPGFMVKTGRVRVAVRAFGQIVLSEAVTPVDGGVTDLGDLIVAPAAACATGTLVYEGCRTGPAGDPFPLFFDTGNGQVPGGDLTPGTDGTFCATLRRGYYYVARREDLLCDDGSPAYCEASLATFDDTIASVCSDSAPVCEDVGTVTMYCDFFGGS